MSISPWVCDGSGDFFSVQLSRMALSAMWTPLWCVGRASWPYGRCASRVTPLARLTLIAMPEIHVINVLAAFLAPLALAFSHACPCPTIVLEIALGIVIGPRQRQSAKTRFAPAADARSRTAWVIGGNSSGHFV